MYANNNILLHLLTSKHTCDKTITYTPQKIRNLDQTESDSCLGFSVVSRGLDRRRWGSTREPGGGRAGRRCWGRAQARLESRVCVLTKFRKRGSTCGCKFTTQEGRVFPLAFGELDQIDNQCLSEDNLCHSVWVTIPQTKMMRKCFLHLDDAATEVVMDACAGQQKVTKTTPTAIRAQTVRPWAGMRHLHAGAEPEIYHIWIWIKKIFKCRMVLFFLRDVSKSCPWQDKPWYLRKIEH